MSACIFFASDAPLPGVFPPPEYDYLAINVDDGTIDDGGADDNFSLRTYPDSFLYTEKAFAVCLDWAYYTEGRARQLIDYIDSALESAPCVELWHVISMEIMRTRHSKISKACRSCVPLHGI